MKKIFNTIKIVTKILLVSSVIVNILAFIYNRNGISLLCCSYTVSILLICNICFDECEFFDKEIELRDIFIKSLLKDLDNEFKNELKIIAKQGKIINQLEEITVKEEKIKFKKRWKI